MYRGSSRYFGSASGNHRNGFLSSFSRLGTKLRQHEKLSFFGPDTCDLAFSTSYIFLFSHTLFVPRYTPGNFTRTLIPVFLKIFRVAKIPKDSFQSGDEKMSECEINNLEYEISGQTHREREMNRSNLLVTSVFRVSSIWTRNFFPLDLSRLYNARESLNNPPRYFHAQSSRGMVHISLDLIDARSFRFRLKKNIKNFKCRVEKEKSTRSSKIR